MNTIVLIPGYMSDKNMWLNQLDILKKKYEVIIPKLDSGNSIEEFKKNTLNLLPERFSAIGFSMGGFVALNLAIEEPERVEELILVGTNARSVSKDRKLLLKKSLSELNNENFVSKFSSSSFYSYFAEHNKTNYEYLNLIKEMVKNLGLDCLKKQTQAILERPLLVHLLSKIKSRCLIISGDLDNLSTKEMNEELSNNIINSELCYIKNSGHFVMIEEEKNFNEIILNWLK